jgi:hypothetical protein
LDFQLLHLYTPTQSSEILLGSTRFCDTEGMAENTDDAAEKQLQSILRSLSEADEDGEPVFVPRELLKRITPNDVADGARVQVGTLKQDEFRYVELEWDGEFVKDGDALLAYARNHHPRKHWDAPLGLSYFLDIVRRAAERRQAAKGDVSEVEYEDDDAWFALSYRIEVPQTNLAEAFERAAAIERELEEAAAQVNDEVGKRAAEMAQILSGWGDTPLEKLVEIVDTAKDTDTKGRVLEELTAQLFASVKGFTVSGRVRTETEEIDITLVNGSDEPRLRKEGPIILVECKNWSSKCGKNEFVVFKEKVENRKGRCTLGVLVSWKGFTGTVTKEMLRGSHDTSLIVPMTGEELREAVRNRDFLRAFLASWERAVML